jgi:hypothetical protein
MPTYEWILTEKPKDSDPFAPLKKTGVLTNAKNRTFNPVKNRAGSAGFQLRTNDPMAYEILNRVNLNDIRGTVRHAVRIRRRADGASTGVDLWSGQIWGIQGNLEAGTIDVSCVGWLEPLQYRMFWGATALDFSNSGLGTPTDQIVIGLMNAINSQDLSHPLYVQIPSGGAIHGVMPNRNRFYQRGAMLGPSIQELSDIEAGVDINVDPVTRQLQLAAWDSYKTSEGWWGGIKNKVILGYNWGNKILKDAQWQEDPSKLCNNMYLQSLGSPVGPVYDPVSQDTYGLFEELNTPSQMNQALLQPFGVAELMIRSRPLVTWTLIPHPRMGTDGPTLFDDFNIGDQIYFTAIKDAVKIKRQAVRVFGATVSLDDNDNETISALQVSPSSGGA